MNWGFSFWGDKSGDYEFDENLYCNISNISNIYRDNSKLGKIKNNTYIYISEGKKVGKIDLTKSNVCEEELYYGHQMIVSHFPKKSDLKGLDILLGNERQPDFKLQIDAWKLMRSLYDESYEYFYAWIFGVEAPGKEDSLAMIFYLKHIAIVWDYMELVMNRDKGHEIHLVLAPLGSLDYCNVSIEDVIAKIGEFIRQLFEIAFSDKRDAVSQYVHDVVVDTAKASAYWMEDFLFVNFLKDFSNECEVFYEYGKDSREERHLSTQTRQSVHTIVKQLDTLHLREVSQDGFYIKRDIINDIGGAV